jgi:2-haloacid dehalogenase
MMVAAHPWDIHGAMQAGLRGAYMQRSPHEPWPAYLMQRPDMVVASFEELAAKLRPAA